MYPGHSASDKPFSSARVILGSQRQRGGVPKRQASSSGESEQDRLTVGMLAVERDAAVKVN